MAKKSVGQVEDKPAPPKVTRRKLKDYIPDPKNVNRGTLRGMQMIEYSVGEFGAARSGVVDKDGIIRAGNHTAEQLYAAGIEDVIEIETTGREWVVVKRADMNEDAGKRYAIADNRTGQLIDFDPDILNELQGEGVDLSQFWTNDELDLLLQEAQGEEPPSDPGAQMDRADELQGKWQVKRGDLFEIDSKTAKGAHRLLCGDSTDTNDVARVMREDHFRMIWTDPPYGINYASIEDSRVRAGRTNNRKSSQIDGDDLNPEQLQELIFNALSNTKKHAEPKAGIYIAAPAGPLYLNFARAIIDAGFSYRQQLIWIKNAPGFGRTHYHYQHEPIIYGWLEGVGASFFVDDHTKVTLLKADKPLDSDEHPTMKPVELITQMIENSSRLNEIVYEPFAGSGSTLVACEQVGRLGRGIEIAERYASVILERLSLMGLIPRKVPI